MAEKKKDAMEAHDRLRLVLEYFNITNRELAQTLSVDPSLVTRWLSGQRQLKAANPRLNALTEYILSRSNTVAAINWLKEQLAQAGLSLETASVDALKQALVYYLASDGEEARVAARNGQAVAQTKAKPVPPASGEEGGTKLGCLAIALTLKSMLDAAPHGGTVDIFLSSDRLTTIVNEDISTLLRQAAEENALTVRLVVCVSGDTQALSGLVDAFLSPIISGHIKLYTVHGVTQSVTNQLYLILPGQAVLLVTETPGGMAPPIATLVRDKSFILEMEASFAASFRYAIASLTLYGDAYTRDMIEILAMEYCMPNQLDVVKDSINPMFMTTAAYDRFLGTRGHAEPEFVWRSAEFVRFKTGMDNNLHSGTVFREIISLARLHDIAQHGRCRMAGLYFMELGYVDLDAQGCMDIINGYIDYLENEPNFSLLILDDLDELHGNNCWHIKRDSHISINNWQGKEPVMIHSDQLMLLREFQARFDALWAKGAGAVGSRANVISILKDAAGRMKNQ